MSGLWMMVVLHIEGDFILDLGKGLGMDGTNLMTYIRKRDDNLIDY